MNTILSRFVLAALATTGFGSAVEVATTPMGYVSQTLTANSVNLVGLTLHKSPVATGQITEVTSTSVVHASSDFSATLVTGGTYILEVTTGNASGIIQEVVNWSGSSLFLVQDLTALGVVAGDSFKLRKAPTLEEIFGTTTTVLTKGFNAVAADNVWVPNGAGGYDKYFLHNSNVWRNAATSASAPNVPLVYTDGILIEKGATSATLIVSGELKKENVNSFIVKGFNVVSVVAPVGATLQNLGLEDDLTPGFNAVSADIVWVPTAAGQYGKYFRHNSGNWRYVNTNTNVVTDIPLGSAIWVERVGGARNISLKTPSFYGAF